MLYCLFDFQAYVKRYLPFCDPDGDIETSIKIFNNIVSIAKDYDALYIMNDNGANLRAKAILSSYKSNRVKAKASYADKKGFVNDTRDILNEVFPIISVQNVEADLLIYLASQYIKKLDKDAVIAIYSGDSDFYQLLDKDTVMYDFNKKTFVTEDNWYKLDNKLKGTYCNCKEYAIQKSIVGDTADAIDGCPNFGWKKVAKLFQFIRDNSDETIILDSPESLINTLDKIKEKCYNILNKSDKNFFDLCYFMLNNNKDIIKRNQKLIDLTMIETPYIYKCMETIKSAIFTPITLDSNELIKKFKLDYLKGDEEYNVIVNRNKSNFVFLYEIIRKFNRTGKKLKGLENCV